MMNQATRKDIRSNERRFLYLLLILGSLASLKSIPECQAQCPWSRQASELNSDCICDFNPSFNGLSSQDEDSSENKQQVNRMSVQCSSVNFNRLLGALKQTASIELPKRLMTDQLDGLANHSSSQIREAGDQLASQSKLDLLHVSHSSIKKLSDFTFIVDTTKFPLAGNNSAVPDNAQLVSSSNLQNLLPNSETHLIVAIQSLHLSKSGLEIIEPNAFNGLEWSLISLSLCDNELEFVPADSLRRLINLKVLDLANNKIYRLAGNSFASLNKLQTLRLADNRFVGASEQIEPNKSQSVDSLAFHGLEKSLQDLSLKNTQLSFFPTAISRLHRLVFLNLAQNQLTQIPSRSFESMQYLTAINLERNRLTHLENGTFIGLESSLSSLSLLGNHLTSYPKRQLDKLSSLGRLDLGFNAIDVLPVDAFSGNPRLILIALDGNPLETLPESAFKPLEHQLQGLSLGGKSLNCDCRLSWMLRWQHENKVYISSRERDPQFCAKPNYLRSLVSFLALKPDHLSCSTNQTVGHPTFWLSPVTQSGWLVNRQPDDTTSKPSIITTSAPSSPQTSSIEPEPSSSNLSSLDLPFPTTLKSTNEDAATTTMISWPTGESKRIISFETSSTSADSKKETTTRSSSPADLNTIPTTQRPQNQTRSTIEQPDERESQYMNKWRGKNGIPFLTEHGGNGIFPDYESFLAATIDGHSRITNRHGILPTVRRIDSSEFIHEPNEILRVITNNNSSQLGTRLQPQLSGSGPSSSGSRRNQHRTSNSNTIADIIQHSNQLANGRQKPALFNSFGSRANDTNAAQIRRQTSRGLGIGNHSVNMSSPSNSPDNSPSVMPAIPTTVNVYKTTNQYYNTSSHQMVPKLAAFSQPPAQSNHSSASTVRLVDSDSMNQSSPPVTTGSSASLQASIHKGQSIAEIRTSSPKVEPNDKQTAPIPSISLPRGHSESGLSLTESEPRLFLAESMHDLGWNTWRRPTSEAPQITTRNMVQRERPTSTPTISNGPTSSTNNTRMSVLSMSRHVNLHDERPRTTMSNQRPQSTSNQISSSTTPLPIERFPTTVTTTRTSHSSPEPTTQMVATVRVVEGQPTITLAGLNRPVSPTYPPSSTPTTVITPGTTTKPITLITTTHVPQSNEPELRTTQTRQMNSYFPKTPESSSEAPIVLVRSTSVSPTTTQAVRSTTHRPGLNIPLVTWMPSVIELVTKESSRRLTTRDQNYGSEITTNSSVRGQQISINPIQVSSENHSDRNQTSRRPLLIVQNRSRQSRDEDTQESIISQVFSVNRQSHQFGRFIKLADFDQFALVLAGLLCISIFIFAITVVCICLYSSDSPTADEAQNSARLTNLHSRQSGIEKSLTSKQIRAEQTRIWQRPISRLVELIECLFCCLFCCRRSSDSRRASRQVTAMRSLILLDDDNSSGSSSGQLEVGSNQARNMVSAVRNKRNPMSLARSKSLLSTNNLMGARRSNTLNRMGPSYMFSGSTASTESIVTGRRGSLTCRPLSMQAGISQRDNLDHWIDSNRSDILSVSCNSDKSCSPRANQKNNYDIEHAHRAYLASSGSDEPVKVGMFLNTQQFSSKSGLLKTVEEKSNEKADARIDCFRSVGCLLNCINDKTITNDCRAPIDRTRKRCKTERRHQHQHQSSSMQSQTTFKGSNIGRRHSIGRAQDLASLAELNRVDLHQTGARTARFMGPNICLLGDELLPMSAEDDCQWPEPYIDPIDEQEKSDNFSGTLQQNSDGKRGNEMKGFRNQRAGPELRQMARYHQQQHLTKNQRHVSMRGEDAYRANWFNIGAHSGAHSGANREVNFRDTWEPEEQSQTEVSSNILAKCRSIPSLPGQAQTSSVAHAQMAGGVSSWLRWSSKTGKKPHHDTENVAESSTSRKTWNSENQIESLYVANNERHLAQW